MPKVETVKIKAAHESQGEFVVINKADFDSDKHELFEQAEAEKPTRARKAKAAQDAE
ncbi:hypothetical protein [Shewanella fodinae]|uniref:hypothetical protein n=1 Tax=Shewanella fodinae TaxID=552357 RepID=UPI001677D7DD|nr:hypothetical protein [Shewanella fodinae]MCL2905225.1 hypothetical protein [Shewanella fodinae]GGY87640.1 hypothetical protein GCM10007169_00990 [Shewanella fodinae]